MKNYYFNELSFTPAADEMQAHETLKTFVHLCIKIMRGYGFDSLALPSNSPFWYTESELAPNYTIRQWLSDSTIEKELKQRYRSIVTKKQAEDIPPPPLEKDVYYEELPSEELSEILADVASEPIEQRSEGMLMAYEENSIVVSFSADVKWHTPYINAKLHEIKASGGGIDIEKTDIEIRNIATIDKDVLLDHIAWIKSVIPNWDKHDKDNPLPYCGVTNLFYSRAEQDAWKALKLNDKIAEYEKTARWIAELNFYEHSPHLTRCNSGRITFELKNNHFKAEYYLALDTETGDFEFHNSKGYGLGEFHFDGRFSKDNSGHKLNLNPRED